MVRAAWCRLAGTITVASLGLVLLTPAQPLPAQAVRGTVVEEGSENPVHRAIVRLVEASEEGRLARMALTDEEGRFEMVNLERGTYLLDVARIGYRAVTLDTIQLGRNETVEVTLELPIDPIPLDEIVARSSMSGLEPGRSQFERRRELGTGFFFDRAAIAALGVDHPSEVFATVPGVRVEYPAYAGRTLIHSEEGWRCMVVVFNHSLDMLSRTTGGRAGSISLGGTFSPRGRSHHLADIEVDDFRLDEVEGIEIYRSFSEIPDELRYSIYLPQIWPADHLGACGFAIVWTTVSW